MVSALRASFAQACDHLDGPDGRLTCAAIFVAVALALVVLDAYGVGTCRRGRRW